MYGGPYVLVPILGLGIWRDRCSGAQKLKCHATSAQEFSGKSGGRWSKLTSLQKSDPVAVFFLGVPLGGNFSLKLFFSQYKSRDLIIYVQIAHVTRAQHHAQPAVHARLAPHRRDLRSCIRPSPPWPLCSYDAPFNRRPGPQFQQRDFHALTRSSRYAYSSHVHVLVCFSLNCFV